MTDVQSQLTRDAAIADNRDPMNNKWGVALNRHTNLYYIAKVVADDFDVSKEVFKEPLSYPAPYLKGQFTKVPTGELAIQQYLTAAWDKSDEQAHKAAGKARAKKVREEEKVADGA